MLDIKRIREDYQGVKAAVESRMNGSFGIEHILELDEKRRTILAQVESMKHKQGVDSKQIPLLKRAGEDTSNLMKAMKALADEIKELDPQIAVLEEEIQTSLLNIPNIPNPSVPLGKDENDNQEIRKWGQPRSFNFEEKPHWDVGTDLDILDFERASKITGARFTVYKGMGARLERSLINYMLNLHTEEHGYTEILPPFMVNRGSMTGTGQLPKFEEDMFWLPAKDFFLVPTAEVPLTNLLGNEILEEKDLPIYYTAYTPCFRKEAGSAGRDTRGLIRQHQFNKVELVKFVRPEKSYEELEALTLAAEEVLKRLELPYRVVKLATGDLGFSSAMTYDLEVWMPSYKRYVEISSCSNFESYQARRANIRFRPDGGGKPEFLHTLNGSGLAVGRTVAAILENYQEEDGSVSIPEVLRPFMGKDRITK